MRKRQAPYQEQQDPIEGETDGDSQEREATPNVHWISCSRKYSGGCECQRRLRRSGGDANAPEDPVGADDHSDAANQGYRSRYNPSQACHPDEHAQWQKKVKDNSRYQNR
jgi:hypothetical protein